MRILIGCQHLVNFGGTETFTYTLSKELSKDNDVSIMCYHHGEVSKRIADFANIIPVTDIASHHFDLALISHNTVVSLPIKATTTLQICHGIFPVQEQPSPLADGHVAISTEVMNHLKKLGYRSHLIHNPIDTERFISDSKSEPIKNVLSLCQGKEANENLIKWCAQLGLSLKVFNKNETEKWSIEEQIIESDLVVSLGRGAMEALCTGRRVIVYDSRAYFTSFSDGLLTNSNYEHSLSFNFSGRATKGLMGFDAFKRHIGDADNLDTEQLQQVALSTFNVQNVAVKFLGLSPKLYPRLRLKRLFTLSYAALITTLFRNKIVTSYEGTFKLKNGKRILLNNEDKNAKAVPNKLLSIIPTVIAI